MKLSPLVVVVVALLSLVFVETAFGFYLPGVAPQGASRASSSSSSFLFAAFFFFSLSLLEKKFHQRQLYLRALLRSTARSRSFLSLSH
jgi:hypothetical protein